MSDTLRILFCTSETVPFAKTGGLADVAGALPRALRETGCDIRIVLPAYRAVDRGKWGFRAIGRGTVPAAATAAAAPAPAGSPSAGSTATGPATVEFWEGRLPQSDVPVYLVAHDPSFDRPGLYGEGGVDYADNLARFAVFGRGTLALTRHLGWRPDVLHCQDWQTALLPVWLRCEPRDPACDAASTLFTIHNLAYQGLFPAEWLPATGLDRRVFTPAGIEFYGQINLLKGGLVFSDLLSTVSEQYAREIQTSEFGCGLEGVLRERRADLVGILNGVDYSAWDPSVDLHLPARYTPDDLSGKRTCKAELQRSQGLAADPAAPLIGMITRLVDQKGLDLVAATLDAVLAQGAQLVLLGTGDPKYHALFEKARGRYPGRVAVTLGFDDGLAHRIEGGADLFLMPSRYEPSGLNQLYSLRYGTVPIVRRTGGLADTIVNATPDALARGTANGFVFEAYEPQALLDAARRALRAYRDARVWTQLQQTGMRQDFSWRRAAGRYLDAYRRAIASRRAGARA